MSGALKLKDYAAMYAEIPAVAAINVNSGGGAYLLSGEDTDGIELTARLVAARLCGLSDVHAFDEHADIAVYPGASSAKKSKSKKDAEKETVAITVDDIRDIVGSLYFTPFELDKRIYIIEKAETMSEICQNKLLKSLEEPPPRVRFILCSTGRLLPTVESRCNRIELPPFSVEAVERALSERHGRSAAVTLAARASRGNIGLAESILADPGFESGYTAAKNMLRLATGSKNFVKTAAIYEKFSRDRIASMLGIAEYILNDIARLTSGSATVFDESDIREAAVGFTPLCAAKCAEHVRVARRHITANGMPTAVMDTLILKIMEEKALCRR